MRSVPISIAGPTTAVTSNWRRWYALAILTAVYVSNIASRFVISTLIEPIKAELHLSDTAIGFLTGTALAIFYTGMGIPLGLLADRVDRRRLIAISIAAWSAMTAACGAAGTYTQLLLARIGVGIGEAGGTPGTTSMLADLFPFSQRVMATSIFTLGAAGGSMLGGAGGGLIANAYGWRAAFYALAVPGIVLAVLILLTLQEPVRGSLDTSVSVEIPSLKGTLNFIRQQRSLVHTLIAATVITYWGWGLLWWTPAFLMRTHRMTIGQAGSLLGTIFGIAGSLGILGGGFLIHKLGRKDPRWQVWVVAFATVIGTCASIVVYAAANLRMATLMLWIFVPVAYLNIAPLLSLTQSLVLPHMRALTCAILVFGANIANLALAPQLIGMMSDALNAHSTAGADSLRGALLVSTLTGFWAAYHLWLAGKSIRSDLERAGVRLHG